MDRSLHSRPATDRALIGGSLTPVTLDGQTTVEGATLTVVATIMPCGARDVLGMYVGASNAEGRDLLARARCE